MIRTLRSSATLLAVAAIALGSATAYAAKPGGAGEQVVLRLGTLDPEGPRAELRLGRDFLLDAELAARIERLPGILSVKLDAADPVPLALVS